MFIQQFEPLYRYIKQTIVMAIRIEVVDINNDTAEEPPAVDDAILTVPPQSNNEETLQTLQPLPDQDNTPVVEKVETAKTRLRPELKEKANCPDCGKELTIHGLKYTHKRYCKAKTPEPPPGLPPQATEHVPLEPEAPIETEEPQPITRRSSFINASPKPRLGGALRIVEAPPVAVVPIDEQICNYLKTNEP